MRRIRDIGYTFICTFTAAVLLALASPAHAQEDATLRVVVTSGEDGSPIAGANAFLISPDEEERYTYAGATDTDGFHEFSGVEPGRYFLEVSFVGHTTHRDTLALESGERRIEHVTLSVDIRQLGEVVVQTERDVTVGEVGVQRISDIDVARIPTPSSSGDLGSYLQTLPGVVSGGDRGGNLFIRGGTPFQNQVLMDNLTVIKPFHISNLYSAFPDQILQNVDLYAGGFGAEYMGVTSAIIDVSLRPGNMNEFNSSGAIGSHMVSFQAEGPLETGRHSFFVMGRKSLIEQSAEFLTGEEDPIGFYDALGRYSYQGDQINCNITAMRTGDRGQIDPRRDIELGWSNTVFGGRCLSYDQIFAKPIEVTLGYSGFTNSERSGERDELSSSLQQQYLKVDHALESLGTIFDYGFSVTFTRYEATLAERFATVESFSNRTAVLEVYASTDLEIDDYLSVQPSMGTQVTVNNSPTFEPRFRLSWRPDGTDTHEISLAAGQYYQISNAISDERDAGTVFTVLTPSDSGDPLQSALHGILGYRLLLGNSVEAKVEGYVKDHSNISVSKWNPEAQIEVKTALADGMTYGFDARLEYDRSPLYLYLGYGWSQVEYEAASGDLGAWIEEPVFSYSPGHDRRHKLNSVASYELGKYTFSTSWEFGTGRPYTRVYGFDLRLNVPDEHPLFDSGTARTLFSRPYGARLPTYHRLDFSVSRSFELSPSSTLEAKAGLINLYDRENIFYFDANLLERVNQTGRLPYFSLRANFN